MLALLLPTVAVPSLPLHARRTGITGQAARLRKHVTQLPSISDAISIISLSQLFGMQQYVLYYGTLSSTRGQ